MKERLAIGFRCHSGWAVMVVVSGSLASPLLVDRRRLQLVGESLPRQPYHAVAEAGVGPEVIAEVEEAAARAAGQAIGSIPDAVAVGVVAAERRRPEGLADILRSHARLHAAEGQLYERAVIEAAGERGLPVHVQDPRTIQLSDGIEALRRSAGSPWQKDHKWAAAAALSALA